MQIHSAAARSPELYSVGAPVGLYGVAHRGQDGQGRLLAAGIQVYIEVAVGTGLATHECVDAPAALEPESAAHSGECRQHIEDLGQRRLRALNVVGHQITLHLPVRPTPSTDDPVSLPRDA